MVSDALVDLVSGSAGGVANVLVGQPMDTVKVCFSNHLVSWRQCAECEGVLLISFGVRVLTVCLCQR